MKDDAHPISGDDWITTWQPLVRRAVAIVARSFRSWRVETYLESADGLIWERLAESPVSTAGNSRVSWCVTVLRNSVIDQWRRDRRQQSNDHALEAMIAQDVASDEIESTSACISPLSSEDLQGISKLRLRPRIVVLAFFGRWLDIAAEDWRAWLQESAIREPFPPENFHDCGDLELRYEIIARALGIDLDSVKRMLRRLKPSLLRLQAFRHLS
ncbi:MAG: hypothetical protein IAG10_24475 [Planctomycetaceae bacterium]|nr:hypothetical protein [Planctomycetaceae bacterium]